MSAWKLTDGLDNLRDQVNARWPNRDHASDGAIGDAAHQAETSGHNPDDTPGSKAEWNGDSDNTAEVRAWDMDSDLGEAGSSAQALVNHLRALPGLSSVLRYMIYNRKIYSASTDWEPRDYTGASAHTEHIHFSGAYTQAADNNTSYNYRLNEVGNMAVTATETTAIANATVDALGTRDNVFPSPSWAASHADNPFWNYAAVFAYVSEDTHARLVAIDLDLQLIKTQLATLLSGSTE